MTITDVWTPPNGSRPLEPDWWNAPNGSIYSDPEKLGDLVSGLFEDWGVVEAERRQKDRQARVGFSAAIKEIGDLEMRAFLAEQFFAATVELFVEAREREAFAEDLLAAVLRECV